MSKSRFRNTLLGIGVTSAALALGYFGVQYFGRNNMFTIAAAVGGAGAISYVLICRVSQKPQLHQLKPKGGETSHERPRHPKDTTIANDYRNYDHYPGLRTDSKVCASISKLQTFLSLRAFQYIE